MSKRILVGLIALPIILPIILWSEIWSAVLILLMCWGGGYEFYSLMEKAELRPLRWLGLLWITSFVLFYAYPLWGNYLPAGPPSLTAIMTGGMIALYIRTLYQNERPLFSWLVTVGGAAYIGILGGQVVALRLLDAGRWWLVLGIIITWANDTAAYFTGTYLGRHLLWPRLSPKKTWEGTIGGLLVAAIISGLYWILFPPFAQISIQAVAGLAVIGGILGLFGDLSISMLKRQIGVKDSGNVFPGHGGMLDRMDSLLFILPFIYHVALFFS
ncbi:MAG: phosphatidate cytidylyltransferase [Chloroflexota bacterium]